MVLKKRGRGKGVGMGDLYHGGRDTSAIAYLSTTKVTEEGFSESISGERIGLTIAYAN